VWQDAQRPFLGVFGRLPSGGRAKIVEFFLLHALKGPAPWSNASNFKEKTLSSQQRERREAIALGTAVAAAAKAAAGAKKAKKGGGVGSFEAKFKQDGTKPVQVWEGKYAILLKSNGWGGNGGENGLKTGVRES
jgi:hypothetical protein